MPSRLRNSLTKKQKYTQVILDSRGVIDNKQKNNDKKQTENISSKATNNGDDELDMKTSEEKPSGKITKLLAIGALNFELKQE